MTTTTTFNTRRGARYHGGRGEGVSSVTIVKGVLGLAASFLFAVQYYGLVREEDIAVLSLSSSSSNRGGATSGTINCGNSPCNSRGERKSSIHVVCPAERTLAINDDTSSLKGFITATLHALSFASKDITGSDRPIEHLASHYDKFTSLDGGFWAEFGVFNGNTLMIAYNNLANQSKFNGVIAGFDSFEGLPDKWSSFDKGAFTSEYETVRNLLPESVELYKSWFQDTIEGFKELHKDVPAAVFIHHDGDLFISTTIALQLLDDRIVQGTHMIFDELVGYPGYENNEMFALWLWMSQQKVTVCAMGHGGPQRIETTDISHWLNVTETVWHTSQSAWFQVIERLRG